MRFTYAKISDALRWRTTKITKEKAYVDLDKRDYDLESLF